MTTTVRRFWTWWEAKAGKCGWVWFITPMPPPWKHRVERFTQSRARLYSARPHETVNHGAHEYARDADGDGIQEVPVNTTEGMWTDVHNFLRPFKGVHQKHLAGYVATAEFRRNLKRITPDSISAATRLYRVATSLAGASGEVLLLLVLYTKVGERAKALLTSENWFLAALP